MADKVQINQTGLVTVYGPVANNQVNQAGLVVVYTQEENPELRIVQAGIAVVYSDQATEGKNQVNAAGIAVIYSDHLASKRKFPVQNPKTRWQTQPGKRKFPVLV